MKDRDKKFVNMLMSKTPQERLIMGCNMFDTAKMFAVSSIKNKNPKISPDDLKKEIFLRFYKKDFNKNDREKIINEISRDRDIFSF